MPALFYSSTYEQLGFFVRQTETWKIFAACVSAEWSLRSTYACMPLKPLTQIQTRSLHIQIN